MKTRFGIVAVVALLNFPFDDLHASIAAESPQPGVVLELDTSQLAHYLHGTMDPLPSKCEGDRSSCDGPTLVPSPEEGQANPSLPPVNTLAIGRVNDVAGPVNEPDL